MIYIPNIQGRENMSLSYEPLWELLKSMNVSKMEFAKSIGISNATLAKIGRNEPITLTIVDKICSEFECRIEDVVQHIPDILLTQANSDLLLDIGYIVQVNPISDTFPKKDNSLTIHHYVILKMEETTVNQMKYYQYTAAPLVEVPTHYLSFYFENVSINGRLSHGWISLDKLGNIPVKNFIKVDGKMPNNIMKKIEKFLDSVKELFND